jgi:uncharacterized protein
MTTQTARGLTNDASDEDRIARYLTTHPDFFERHTGLLAKLRLPHARSDAAVSLVERQVEVLRDQRHEAERKLSEFVSVARANDALSDRIHLFTRRLLGSRSAADAVRAIEVSLREDFDTSHAVLVLSGADPALADATGERFLHPVAADDANLRSFDTLFAAGKPRCGQVRDTQRDFLFGSDASEVGSVALIPLVSGGVPIGLLALGSTDRDRFHPGMSTDFLKRMGELIADALSGR